jgi:hypothetical protein
MTTSIGHTGRSASARQAQLDPRNVRLSVREAVRSDDVTAWAGSSTSTAPPPESSPGRGITHAVA